MATIEHIEVNTWPDLHRQIDEYFTHYNGYVHRGQANAAWKLESTLTRSIHRTPPDNASMAAVTLAHLEAFKDNIRGRCNIDLEKATPDEIWALGQHFGLFTPLLDWSRSPYVALFFALQGKCESGRRVLWSLLEDDVSYINASTKGKNSLRVIRPLTHSNPRLVSQNGIFLQVGVGDDVEDVVRNVPPSAYVTMFKISFPDGLREEATSALNNMNINYTSLFPDLSGSALHTNYLLEIEPYLEQMREAHRKQVAQ